MKSTLTHYQAQQAEKIVDCYARHGIPYDFAVYLLAQVYMREGVEITVANLRRPFLPMEREYFGD